MSRITPSANLSCALLSRRDQTRRIDPKSGHRPFSALTKTLPAARKARIADKAAALNTALALHELRKARTISSDGAVAIAPEEPAAGKKKRG